MNDETKAFGLTPEALQRYITEASNEIDGFGLTPEEREQRIAEDRLVLDPFLQDLRALVAKHPKIDWYIDPGDPTQFPNGQAGFDHAFDGIEFCYGLAVEWVYCEQYPVLRPVEDDA